MAKTKEERDKGRINGIKEGGVGLGRMREGAKRPLKASVASP